MHSLVVLCLTVAAASAATPFFESPHNERASAFYKVPLNQEYNHGAAPVHRPPPSFHSAPAYRPQAAQYQPSYRPEPSYQHRPQAAHYQPSYRPESSHYQPSNEHGHGATSFQTVHLGEPSYGHHNSHY